MIYWVIQHRNQGVFVGFDYGKTSGEWKPHFRWSIGLSDGETFFSEAAANAELAKIEPHVKGCFITQLTTGKG
jgi:hypothetical protein